MRDYTKIDRYLTELQGQIYPQPSDDMHTSWAKDAISAFIGAAPDKVQSVLDVGCGVGFCQDLFRICGVDNYVGVALGEDVVQAKTFGRPVEEADFSFLPYKDSQFDLVFSRHSLEHSPMPLLTLMEWKRVSRKYLAVVLPSPNYWTYGGANHYYVLNSEQWRNLFAVAGFKEIFFNTKSAQMCPNSPKSEIEYWFLLERNDK